MLPGVLRAADPRAASHSDAVDLAPLFKALGDPVRLRLLSLIACHDGGEACVCELTDAFDVSAPTISHHLKVLREAGLITSERRGTWIYYRISPEVIARISSILGTRHPHWPEPRTLGRRRSNCRSTSGDRPVVNIWCMESRPPPLTPRGGAGLRESGRTSI